MKKLIALSTIIAAVFCLSMNTGPAEQPLRHAVISINQLYLRNVHELDSFLAAYPAYFYEGSFAVREKKYEEFAYYFRRAAGLMVCLQPKLYYKKLVGPFQFEKNKQNGFWGVLPPGWLFQGPIGNEPDSLMKTFSKSDSLSQISFIQRVTRDYRAAIAEIKESSSISDLNASGLFDLLRTEMFRISTIDVANSDFIIEEAAMPGLNGSVESWLQYAGALFNQSSPLQHRQWNELSARTLSFLHNNKDYGRFDRLYFIKSCLLPLSEALAALQVSMQVPVLQKWAAVRPGTIHLYGNNVFNADFFAPDSNAFYSADKAALGKLLFFDPILSDNNRRACASCHKPRLAFTDGQPKATSFDRTDLPRNSPTVINAGFQKRNFWDQRAGSLEDQLDSVINNPNELHSSFGNVIERINASPEYLTLFHRAFPATRKKGIRREDVKSAIGVYERTLTGFNSRFDQYMRGNQAKLSAAEARGFNLYMGKAKCGVCHFAPLFNGAVPPFYEMTDHHSIGVPLRDSMDKYQIDPDTGMLRATANEFTRFSFKTPSLRNAALTAPYMHNGIYKTLEQVVDFYNHAGGTKFMHDYGKSLKGLPFFTILPIELKLTADEKKDLVAFIKTLTDNSPGQIPTHLPEIKGRYASINNRKIGGAY